MTLGDLCTAVGQPVGIIVVFAGLRSLNFQIWSAALLALPIGIAVGVLLGLGVAYGLEFLYDRKTPPEEPKSPPPSSE